MFNKWVWFDCFLHFHKNTCKINIAFRASCSLRLLISITKTEYEVHTIRPVFRVYFFKALFLYAYENNISRLFSSLLFWTPKLLNIIHIFLKEKPVIVFILYSLWVIYIYLQLSKKRKKNQASFSKRLVIEALSLKQKLDYRR